jgi:hypothetical protein
MDLTIFVPNFMITMESKNPTVIDISKLRVKDN